MNAPPHQIRTTARFAPLLTCLLLATTPFATLADLELWSSAPLDKIGLTQPPAPQWNPDAITLDAVGNESEAAQIVVRSKESVSNLVVTLPPLTLATNQQTSLTDWRLRKVEWININLPASTNEPARTPDWQPDPLLPTDPAVTRFTIEPGTNLVFWAIIRIPPNATPGTYEGRFDIGIEGAPPAHLPIRLNVRPVSLPQRPILQSLINIPIANIHRAHGCKTQPDRQAVTRLYLDEYIRARLSPFLCTPAFSLLPNCGIAWTFDRDTNGIPTGAASFDFTGFDQEAELYFNQKQAFSAFNIAPTLYTRRDYRAHSPAIPCIRDRTGFAIEQTDTNGVVNPLFEILATTVFRSIHQHLEAKGWLDRALYYIDDEPWACDAPGLAEICRIVQTAAPRLRTAVTCYVPEAMTALASHLDSKGQPRVSTWISLIPVWDELLAKAPNAWHGEQWAYDIKYLCLMSDTGLENRLALWLLWQRKATGYLYYSSASWDDTETPWLRPNFGADYLQKHGDGYLFFPPTRNYDPPQPILDHIVTTIRWELLREGAEDYDLLRMLEQATQQAEKQKYPESAIGRDALNQAKACADWIDWITTNPKARAAPADPARLLATRTALADALVQLTKTIQRQ